MRYLLIYTLARIAIFLVTFGVIWIVGAKSWLGLLLAILISGVISYVLLDRQRKAMSAAMVNGKKRMVEATKREDDF